MPLSIGVNLRVTGHCNQGGRKYMEDMFSVAFQPTADDKDLEYAFFGIFDGHGGGEAASFAKEHLMDIIVKQKNFWSDRDEDVLRAIKDGYVNTHYAMWRELDKWPRTASGLPSTAGTTATIAFIRKGKIYIGHVGDSGVVLGYRMDGDPQWKAKALTKDHKPESGPEMMRIQQSGGKVVSKSGVPRVVWNRPRIGHKGPVRRSTHIDEIPFLAVARSLGDLWSYNSELDTFVVSPEPDVRVVSIDVKSHKCLIFGTDGLWNMLTPHAAVAIVQSADRHNEKQFIASQQACSGQAADEQKWVNPSKSLVDRALERWSTTRLRADNTSAVTLMLDPPGPSRTEVLLSQREGITMNDRVLTPPPVLIPIPKEEDNEPPIPPLTVLPRPSLAGVESLVQTRPEDLKSPSLFPCEGEEDNVVVLPYITASNSSIAPRMPSQDLTPYPAALDSVANTPADRGSNFWESPEEEEGDIQRNLILRKPSSPVLVPIEYVLDPDLYDASIEESKRPPAAVKLPSAEKPDSSDEMNSVPQLENAEGSAEDSLEEIERKSIQVAEISSSALPRTSSAVSVPKEVELTTFDKTVLRTSTKQQTTIVTKDVYEGESEGERLRLCVPKVSKSSPEKLSYDSSKVDMPTKPNHTARPNILKKKPEAPKKNGTPETEILQEDDASGTVRKLLSSLSNEITIIRRRRVRSHSQTSSNGNTGSSDSINDVVSMNLRLKSRNGKMPTVGNLSEEGIVNKTDATKNNGSAKRKHSAISQALDNPVNDSCGILEPSLKRRTRSDDQRSPTDENDPANQVVEEPKSRLGWASSESLATRSAGNTNNVQERRSSPNRFQRRSLGKKATPVKAIRRPSPNGSNRIQQLRGSFSLRDWDQSRSNQARNCNERRLSGTVIGPRDANTSSQRWLRSDTLAATVVKTLRSRNVDINGQTIPSPLSHQYGVGKQNRLPVGGNLKQSSGNNTLQSVGSRVRSSSVSPAKFKQASGNNASERTCSSISPTSGSCSANSAMAKRVKSPYNPGSRTLATRSRIKILPYGK